MPTMDANKQRVIVAMSGGVDSSVAAALLVRQGFQVSGMMLRLWSEESAEQANRCCTPDAVALARRVSAILGIPFYVLDAKETFKETVLRGFLDGSRRGETPNPCLVCNRDVRWGFLFRQARLAGADYLATGHYARIVPAHGGGYELHKGVDERKDQSYVLHMLDQERLAHTLLPLGGLTKAEVRDLAAQLGLPVAQRHDSQDLCFLGGEDYRQFLLRRQPDFEDPGPILDENGNLLGRHRGLAFYTIGQRKGLGIAAPQPLYVKAKLTANNSLIVAPRARLGQAEFTARDVCWIAGRPPAEAFRAEFKIRYQSRPVWGSAEALPGARLRILLDQPLPDITPGQSAVAYHGQVCLGGGVIEA